MRGRTSSTTPLTLIACFAQDKHSHASALLFLRIPTEDISGSCSYRASNHSRSAPRKKSVCNSIDKIQELILFYNSMAGTLKRPRSQILRCDRTMRVPQSREAPRQSNEHHLRAAQKRSIGMKVLILVPAKPVAVLGLPSRMKKTLPRWCWLNRTLRTQIIRAATPNQAFFLKLFLKFAAVFRNENGNPDLIFQLFQPLFCRTT